MAPLDDHATVLGEEFLKIAKAILVPYKNNLVFLGETKTWSLPMMTRIKFGHIPRMSSMFLEEISDLLVDMPYSIAC